MFERYGEQEGVKKGYNPKKRGRGSHHPLLAVLGEAYFILHGWLRSGNTRADSGVVEFLKEALAKLESSAWIRRVRADSGFFAEELLQYLEELKLGYIVVARLTPWLKREAARVTEWRALDAVYAVGEFELKLLGWDRARRFVVVREEMQERKPSRGRKLLEVPGYTFRIFVTNLPDPPEEIWRDYNQRACIEQRIEELKSDLAADDFCLQRVLCHRGGLPEHFDVVQPAGGIPARQRHDRLSTTGHLAGASVSVRSHSGPSRPSHRCCICPPLGEDLRSVTPCSTSSYFTKSQLRRSWNFNRRGG